MMKYKPEVQERLEQHYKEALEHFDEIHTVGIFLQGSQNYNLDTEYSDVDSKLLVLPTMEDIIFNKAPISTTFVRQNDEHIDFKDIRLYLDTCRKQNINFVEILFTPYHVINPIYKEEFQPLIDNRELIAHYNIYSATKAMYGMAIQKFHAMEHPYPSKMGVLAKYGYDPKQLHHLLRLQNFMKNYVAGELYENCLTDNASEYLKAVKMGKYNLEEAREVGRIALDDITEFFHDNITKEKYDHNDKIVEEILFKVQINIMLKEIKLSCNSSTH